MRSHIVEITNRRYTIKTRRAQVKKVRDRILRLYSPKFQPAGWMNLAELRECQNSFSLSQK
ncbi:MULTISPECIES: hypothetical protein [Cyanophyceae]|uniref:hypothetical protein n=1 Tax=Cyanophyceae TaxID=3028117 RepID=UPI001684FB69|nr:hypothetical protein [Trichocoleus sp. FACHB-40]MBD2006671.1 hypothetical protein [Trichocoleus sp. FACHB-40]